MILRVTFGCCSVDRLGDGAVRIRGYGGKEKKTLFYFFPPWVGSKVKGDVIFFI